MAERQLAVVQTGEIVAVDEWSDTRKEFIRKNFCGGAPDAIASTFLGLCERRRLSPEARHVYLINRAKKGDTPNWVIQTGIDGYRLIADRTGRYVGSDDPVFEYNAERTQIVRATVTVRKLVSGTIGAFTASARMDEYAAGSPMWNKMPHTMIAKCAEALALRKAFPEELSGLYTDAEMDQAESSPNAAPALTQRQPDAIAEGPPPITEPQMRRLRALQGEKGLTNEQIKQMHGKSSAKELTVPEASALITALVAMPDIELDEVEADQEQLVTVNNPDWWTR